MRERRRGFPVRVAAAAIFLLIVATPALAQNWLILNGLADGEFWATDSGSFLLTRNNGHPGVLERLRLFAGVAPSPAVQLVAIGLAKGGSAYDEDAEVGLEAISLRLAPSRALVVEGGKIISPIGAFGPRRFSTTNPLIGEPDGYPTGYPWGAQVSGTLQHFDYRLGVVSLPPVHDGYVPPPQGAPRLVVGGGITPMVGVRIGGSFTRGPYLGDVVTPFLATGSSWKSFRQQVVALDGRASRGYVDLHAEWAHSWFEVPFIPGRVAGSSYYLELKYTWSPRFFTAARFQRNDYPFILPISRGFWIGKPVNFYAGELGLGVRLGGGVLAKVSYQRDDWTDPGKLDGRALAAQLSWQFDATRWLP